jgi:2,4-dienoyl-CoA reductase-like NADH-dependent reductase (Old Yellow Enzyme family)
MMGGLYDWPDMDALLKYLILQFDKTGLRLLDISCANSNYFETSQKVIRKIRSHWNHFLIGGASLTLAEATEEFKNGRLDMVTWGRAFIANPDLVQKFKLGVKPIEFDDTMRLNLI